MLVTLVFLAFVLTSAQERFTPCTPAEKFIAVTVTAKTIPASDNTPARNIWILVGTPGPDQVVVPGDDVLKTRILELMQEIVDSGAELGIGKGGNQSLEIHHNLNCSSQISTRCDRVFNWCCR